MFSEPLVFCPLPALVPFGTPSNTAAVDDISLLGTIKSFHSSAKVPPSAPVNALINPLYFPTFLFHFYFWI
jgi:hypothetical protein